MSDKAEGPRAEHIHEWFMAWDYCGSHSYICRVCSEILDDDVAEKRVNEHPALLARLEAAEKALRFVDAWMQTPAPPWPNEKEAANAYAVARTVQAALAREETPHE